MRARFFAVAAAAAVVALAGCSSSSEADTSADAESTPTATSTPSPVRAVNPDAPEGGILDKDDAMGHKVCEMWTTKVDDDVRLPGVVGDVNWYSQQADNEVMSSDLKRDWATDNPEQVTIFCGWNGYEPEKGSPADLLG